MRRLVGRLGLVPVWKSRSTLSEGSCLALWLGSLGIRSEGEYLVSLSRGISWGTCREGDVDTDYHPLLWLDLQLGIPPPGLVFQPRGSGFCDVKSRGPRGPVCLHRPCKHGILTISPIHGSKTIRFQWLTVANYSLLLCLVNEFSVHCPAQQSAFSNSACNKYCQYNYTMSVCYLFFLLCFKNVR